jgi:hypothetical protein
VRELYHTGILGTVTCDDESYLQSKIQAMTNPAALASDQHSYTRPENRPTPIDIRDFNS